MGDVFNKLADYLDKTPAGFPATESGIEIKILKRLFTPEEAELTLVLSMMPEPVSEIAKRIDVPEDDLGVQLESMAKKGLIFRARRGDNAYYMVSQFVVGIWEYNLKNLTPDLIKEVNEYLPEYMEKSWLKHDTKQLRVIPISEDVTGDASVVPYETAEELIKMQSKIVISDCICRKEHQIMGKGCDYLMEGCFSFGNGAYYYEENGLGRGIDQEEALAILKKGQEQGLVLQPGNAQKSSSICMCCGCCCQVLGNAKKIDAPAEAVHSNYYAVLDADECVSCEACADKCHVDAITMEDTAVINPKRCIGCGVCVPECPTDAIQLMQKATGDQYVPPATVVETLMHMASERGNI